MKTGTSGDAVAVVVDPQFGGRLIDRLERLPMSIADTANKPHCTRACSCVARSGQRISHTSISALTTFTIDTDATPDSYASIFSIRSSAITTAARIHRATHHWKSTVVRAAL
jgi:hypothetical protein